MFCDRFGWFRFLSFANVLFFLKSEKESIRKFTIRTIKSRIIPIPEKITPAFSLTQSHLDYL